MKKIIRNIALFAIIFTLLLSGCSSAAPAVSSAPPAAAAPAAPAPSAAPSAAPAQPSEPAWPTKPITIIVPASAGGGTDLSCRLVTKYLSKALGQPITVTNIKGAGGSTGTKEAMDASNDGYTMLYIHEDIVTNEVLGVSDFGFRNFEIAGKIFDVTLLGVIAGPKYKNVADVKAAADANPGAVSFAIDIATSAHVVPLLMQNAMDIQLKLVDGGSLNDRIPLLISGQLDLTFAPLGPVKDYLENGDINCVGILSPERSELKNDVPTFKEQGADVICKKFFNIYLPKETPESIVKKVTEAMETISKDPEFIKESADFLYDVSFAGPQDTVKVLEETEKTLSEYKEMILQSSQK